MQNNSTALRNRSCSTRSGLAALILTMIAMFVGICLAAVEGDALLAIAVYLGAFGTDLLLALAIRAKQPRRE